MSRPAFQPGCSGRGSPDEARPVLGSGHPSARALANARTVPFLRPAKGRRPAFWLFFTRPLMGRATTITARPRVRSRNSMSVCASSPATPARTRPAVPARARTRPRRRPSALLLRSSLGVASQEHKDGPHPQPFDRRSFQAAPPDRRRQGIRLVRRAFGRSLRRGEAFRNIMPGRQALSYAGRRQDITTIREGNVAEFTGAEPAAGPVLGVRRSVSRSGSPDGR